ncbi:MAG: hypothetical protein RSE18_08490 [Acinetobacter sp.]
MTDQEIRDKAPSGATGYIIGRVTGNVIYVKDNMIWCYTHKEWTSFVHNMEIKLL